MSRPNARLEIYHYLCSTLRGAKRPDQKCRDILAHQTREGPNFMSRYNDPNKDWDNVHVNTGQGRDDGFHSLIFY